VGVSAHEDVSGHHKHVASTREKAPTPPEAANERPKTAPTQSAQENAAEQFKPVRQLQRGGEGKVIVWSVAVTSPYLESKRHLRKPREG
jgi:hypothetical protein